MNLKAVWLAAGLIGFGIAAGPRALAMESESEQARRERVEEMTMEEKEELRQKQERFVSLSQQEQDRIRKLHDELTTRDDADKLRAVLERYHAWLATLSSAERAELLSLPADQRLDRIKKMMAKQEDDRFKKEVSDKLTSEDREAIMKWLLAFAEEHRQEILDALPVERRPPASDRWPLMFTMLRAWGTGELNVPRPQPDDVQKLIDALSPTAQETIKGVRDPQKRMEVAQRWIRAAFESRRWRSPPPVSRDELRKFYVEKLSAAERERLEALSPEEMQQALQRTYYEHQFRGRGFGPGGPGSPGRGGGSGGPRGGGPGKDDRRDDKKEGRPPAPPEQPLD